MTQLLIKALEAAFSQDSPAKQKELQNHIATFDIPMLERQLGQTYMIKGEDGKIGKARELLLTEKIDAGSLIHSEVHRTVMEGAKVATCMREAIPIYPMTSNSMDVPIRPAGRYAPFVGEGSQFTSKNQDYTKMTLTAKKIGEIPLCSKEMVADSQFAAIEMEMRAAGEACENSMNQWMLKMLLDNAGNEYDINAAVGVLGGAAAIREAKALIAADGFHADTVIYNPVVETYIAKDYTPIAYNPVAQEQMRSGDLPPVLGCKLYPCGVELTTTTTPTKSASYVWGAPDNAYIGMVLVDRAKCGGIGMREDINIEDFADPIRDLVGGKISMRVACNYAKADAISRVEYGGA
jgi:hypothetical protein